MSALKDSPVWIKVGEDGDIFEGHQLNWANCFFSNALPELVEAFIIGEFPNSKFTIVPMTKEQLEEYPEAVEYFEELIDRYGDLTQ